MIWLFPDVNFYSDWSALPALSASTALPALFLLTRIHSRKFRRRRAASPGSIRPASPLRSIYLKQRARAALFSSFRRRRARIAVLAKMPSADTAFRTYTSSPPAGCFTIMATVL